MPQQWHSFFKTAPVILQLSIITNVVSITNKQLMHSVPSPVTVSIFQTLVLLLGYFGLWKVQQNPFPLDQTKALYFSVTGIATGLNFLSSMKTLRFASLATLSVVHNISLILVAVFDVLLFHRKFHFLTILSIFVVIAGGMLYCLPEASIYGAGYFWVVIYLTAHEIQSLYTKYINLRFQYTPLEMSLYNSLWSFPILLIYGFFAHEKVHLDNLGIPVILLVCFICVFISFLIFSAFSF